MKKKEIVFGGLNNKSTACTSDILTNKICSKKKKIIKNC